MLSRRAFLRIAGATAGTGVLTGAYAFGIEPTWLRTVRHEAPVRGLDPALDGLRIVQLSDLHAGRRVPLDYLREAVDDAMALQPDLVVLTGDFVHRGGDRESIRNVAGLVERLRAPDGVYGVFGNHDHGVYQPGGRGGDNVRLRDELGAAGLELLRNKAALLRGGGLRLAGYEDLWSGAFNPAAIQRLDELPTVALSHNPDTAPSLAHRGAALILSGHTHGGQVSIPVLGPPILPVERREYAAGPYDLGATRLYVNRGIGWLVRVRMFVRPEVTLHILRAVPVA